MTQFPFTSQLRAKTILIPTFKSITLVDPDEITYVKAMQNYCMLYKQDGSRILSSSSFGSIIEQLDFHGFYHCHKSYAINMSKVMRYLNTGQVELQGEVLIPVARRRKKEFLQMINQGVDRSSRELTVRH